MRTASIARKRSASLVALALAATGTGGCLEWGSGDLELEDPTVKVEMTLDKATYDIGDPVKATITVTNIGEVRASIAVPSSGTLEIYMQDSASKELDPTAVEYVTSPLDTTVFREVDSGEALDPRVLCLPRTTTKAGTFKIWCRYRTEDAAISRAGEAWSEPVPFAITDKVSMKRDRYGHLEQTEAVRVATEFYGREVASSESIVRLDETRLQVFLVTLHFKDKDKDGHDEASCFVSPYTGKVTRESKVSVRAAQAEK